MRARILVAMAALLGSAPAVQAQQQLTIGAVIPIASPTGAGTRNLAFGVITPGAAPVVVTVPAAAAAVGATVHAGEYRFDVSSSRGLSFTMTTPTQLTTVGLPPLAVSFNGTQYGAYCVTSGGSACTTTAFNPATATNVNVCFQRLGNGNCHPNKVYPIGSTLSVLVGGALTVPPGTPAATYTATVTLTITQVY